MNINSPQINENNRKSGKLKSMRAAFLAAALFLPFSSAQNTAFAQINDNISNFDINARGGFYSHEKFYRGVQFEKGHSLAPIDTKKPVDYTLVLALDISKSVRQEEYEIQIDAIADALENEKLFNAWFGFEPEYRGGGAKSIAISIVEFGDAANLRVPWVDFRTDDKNLKQRLSLYAKEIRKMKAMRNLPLDRSTAISEMLGYVRESVLTPSPFKASIRNIVNVMGDGKDNISAVDNPLLEKNRQALAEMDTTINAMAIVNDVEDLDDYYRENLVTQREDLSRKTKAVQGNVWVIARKLADFGNSAKKINALREEALKAMERTIVSFEARLDNQPAPYVLGLNKIR